MNIRPAAPADLPAILRLAAATPEASIWPPAVYESYIAESHPESRLFVAEKGGNPVGFLASQMMVGVCELQSIAVAPQHRRAGIGQSLLAALADWAARQGAVKIELEVRAGNYSAISFYARHKFQADGRRPAYYRNPEEDALLMSLPLPPPNSASSSFPPQID